MSMLHRSFKPAKCKTALKLAVSRIKLLKNKRDVQLKQLKREVAQLLESGQDRTARIRVEHVVREEKTTAAYELIEIYCELIVARLSIIESQKNCPIDLKEAISSVIFAAPRCADVPELMDIRKQFTAKYGKDFVSAAIELRPDCGVGRMLVEKLSAKAPDGQTKIKILSTIAEENNVKWDPNSLEEQDSRPPEDILNGPNTFEKASKIYVEPHVQVPPSHDDKGPPNVRSSPHLRNPDSDIGAKGGATFGTFQADMGSSGNETEETESRHSYSGSGNALSMGRQNWNMEFKDATAAAQAAAESAERASMAARAAAELSSRAKVIKQYSVKSHKSSTDVLSGEGSQKYSSSESRGEPVAKRPVSNAFPGRNSSIHDEIDHAERDILAGATESFYRDEHKDSATSTWSASSKSTTASIDKNPLASSSQETDRYPQKTLSELKNRESFGRVSLKKQSSNNEIEILGELNDGTESENSNNEIEFVGELNDGTESENVNYIGDLGTRRQSSRASSDSYSRTFINDHNDILNLNHPKLGTGAGQRPFVIDEGNTHSDNEKTTSYDKGFVVFDEYGSDDGDDYKFDVENEFKGQESSLYFSSPGRKSAVNLLENTDAWRLGKNMDEPFEKSISQSHSFGGRHSSHVFPETSSVPTEPHDSLDATFDNSDDQSSDDNENLEKSKFVANTEPGIYPSKQDVYERNSELNKSASHGLIGSSSAEKEHVAYKRKPLLPPSSVDSDPMEVCLETNQGKELHAVSDRKFGNSDLPSSKYEISGSDSSIEDKEHMPQLPDTWKDNELLKESSLESGNELKFGKLTGGLRNKGLRRPPYSRDPSGHASLFKQASGDSSSKIEQFSSPVMVRTTINPDAHNQEPHNQKVTSKQSKGPSSKDLVSSSDSDNDDSEQPSPQNISINQEPYNRKVGTEVNENSSSNIRIPYFDADTSDSEEDLPKQASTSNIRPITGFSRRTKAASSSTRSSYLKATDGSDVSLTPDYEARRKSSSRSSYATEVPAKPLSQTKSSDHLGSSERRVTAEQSTSKPMPASKRSLKEESLKSSTRKYSSSSLPKIRASGSSEISESASLSTETPPTEKASHVHPKLPDYDALAAQFQSLRRSRE
ncbi:probable GPI-anchored adhesin-like protein PGA55 isoform X2 [Juglans microcarpa x Juglans regia]|uniref:probable GPI-anchored adhesin-like protein PGA55 isoform X2 n=1 Tax=Juglans microcarpa x Juglans regia TaxID=2249226 RepID=UPI001B7EB86E|nr:probable GPI-anchored adhesin-like protein PGA55 isoform X2 [Juglans microcarpa x Juglans regia]